MDNLEIFPAEIVKTIIFKCINTMLRKIYISGAHSVGKSLLWETLKKELYLKDTKLIFCAETGREIATEQGHTNVSIPNLCKINITYIIKHCNKRIISSLKDILLSTMHCQKQ